MYPFLINSINNLSKCPTLKLIYYSSLNTTLEQPIDLLVELIRPYIGQPDFEFNILDQFAKNSGVKTQGYMLSVGGTAGTVIAGGGNITFSYVWEIGKDISSGRFFCGNATGSQVQSALLSAGVDISFGAIRSTASIDNWTGPTDDFSFQADRLGNTLI